MTEPNPYAPPLVESLAKPDLTSVPAPEIREAHLSHEAALRAVGLYYLTTSVTLVAVVPLTLGPLISDFNQLKKARTGRLAAETEFFVVIVTLFIVLLLAVFGIIVAIGLIGSRRWVRRPAIICATFSLVFFPIGTCVNAYLLYLIYSRPGKVVFSGEYSRIVERTPKQQQKLYERSVMIWLMLLGVALLVFGGVLTLAAIMRK